MYFEAFMLRFRVLGWGVAASPWVVCHAGQVREGCVAPSLTLVLGPWWCWSGDMMIDRVSPQGYGRFVL